MRGVMEALQFNKRKDAFFYLSLVILAMLAFLFLGEPGYYLIDDSESYMDIASGMEGVMPVYPLFLHGNKLLFGESRYLYPAVVEQSIFAAICVILFLRMIKKQFRLKYWETYICFFLALLTFTADMPETMVTREILTEGIAYAAFYLFAAALLQTVWHKSWKWYAALCIVTLFLSAVRSQLQILFVVCGIVCIYIAILGKRDGKKGKTLLRLLLGMLGCLATVLIGIWITSRVAGGYRVAMNKMKVLQRQTQQIAQEEPAEAGNPDDMKEQESAEADKQENVKESGSGRRKTTSQYISLIFNKGMYEADYEDYQLFGEEQIRNLYLRLYDRIDREQYRYAYAKTGLWMWRDIMDSALIGVVCMSEQTEYYSKEYPELFTDGTYFSVSNQNWVEMGITLLKAHWGRFLYHTLMLLPQAFVSTVFFQIERIYLLCHLITLFLYLTAIALMVWAYWDKKVKSAYGEFMCAVLGTNIVLVVVISLVFFGQKRYLFYNFGIFYISYFLLLLQLWKLYVRDFVMRKTEIFKKRKAGEERMEGQGNEE